MDNKYQSKLDEILNNDVKPLTDQDKNNVVGGIAIHIDHSCPFGQTWSEAMQQCVPIDDSGHGYGGGAG